MAKRKSDEVKNILKPDVAIPVAQNKSVEKEPVKTEPQQEQQYYILPDNQTQPKDFGFGIPVNAGTPEDAAAARKNLRKKDKSKANGIAAYILFAIGVAFGVFGIYMKTTLFVDNVSTIILSIFGFGIIVYGCLFIAVILELISLILAFVQLGKNRRAFSIVTAIILPLLNIAALILEAYFILTPIIS